jgi:ADP-heptose:LPS heptosyltransferase
VTITPQGDYRRILVTLLSPIGDTLFATAAIHRLRQAYPRACITALVFPTNRGILEGNGDVDEVLLYPTLQKWMGWRYLLRLLSSLRARRFDLAVDLCTAFWLTRLLVAPRKRVRLKAPPWWWLIPGRGEPVKRSHAVYHYLQVVESLGLSGGEPRPHLSLDSGERGFAESYLASHGSSNDRLLVAIHPGGEGFYGKKRWPEAGFARLGDELSRRHGARILILGGDADREVAHRVAARMACQPINGAGQTTLKETAALVERCHLFIGNDSSPLHLAAAVGTPVVGIYGPSNPTNFSPLGVPHAIVRARRPCAPCFHFIGAVPLWQRSFCRRCHALEEISVGEVLEAAEKVLAESYQPAGVS